MTAEDFRNLLKAGKINEARNLLEVETAKAKFAPDTVTMKKGEVTITRRGKEIEQDAEGNWRLKEC